MMLMSATFLVPLLVVAITAAAGILSTRIAFGVRRAAALSAPAAVVPAVLLALFGAGHELHVPWLLFGAQFTVDPVARPLLLVAALLYGGGLLALTWLKLRHVESGSGALTSFMLMSFVGNIGTYLAADTVSFYLFFALMSFSAAGLVVHYRSRAAHRATRVYLVMSVLSETAILAAFMLTVHAGGLALTDAPRAIATGDHLSLTVVLLFVGLGVKAGLVPLHVWLPLAHPAAPPAASAVLSGAMVKAGLVGWLRFLPLGHQDRTVEILGWVLLSLALIGAFVAVLVGILQKDPKVVLAYSTISQLGFITAVVAAGLLEPELAPLVAAAAVVYAVHHGLAKGTLFLGVPVVKHYGRGATGVVVAIGMIGAGLAVAGAPLTSGAFGKYVSKEAVAPISVLGVGLDSILPLVATGSTLLLLRFAWVLWNTDRDPRRRPDGELVSWLLVAAAGIVVPWLVGERWTPVPVPGWEPYVVWNAVWPILLGLALGGTVWWLQARDKLPGWAPRADGTAIQPGDVLGAEENAVSHAARTGGQFRNALHHGTETVARGWARFWSAAAEHGKNSVYVVERRLENWSVSGSVLLLLLAGPLAVMVLAGRWFM
ncbi:complex I subunit 5 family protein [Kocuria sp. CPCC 205235]|uniref:proton-conducting transporter transmembrane domain-containing protein n=1 Tax=Kocuria sp. CPCC 205235 TaxID=3073549 RepID=UPI0034D54901